MSDKLDSITSIDQISIKKIPTDPYPSQRNRIFGIWQILGMGEEVLRERVVQ